MFRRTYLVNGEVTRSCARMLNRKEYVDRVIPNPQGPFDIDWANRDRQIHSNNLEIDRISKEKILKPKMGVGCLPPVVNLI